MLSVNNLSLEYPYGGVAFQDVFFEINNSERILCVCGDCDSGKTSLIKTICHIISPSSGLVWMANILINNRNASNFFQILPKDEGYFNNMTVFANLDYLLKIKSVDKNSRNKIINHTLDELNVQFIKYEKVSNLSLVEKATFLLSKLYISNSKILLIDDIFSGLSISERGRLISILRRFIKNKNKYAIYTTSCYEDAISLNVDTILLRYGIVEQYGNSKSIKTNPQNLYIDSYINKERNFIKKKLLNPKVAQYLSVDSLKSDDILSYELVEGTESIDKIIQAKAKDYYYGNNFYYVTTDLGTLISLELKDNYNVSIDKNVRYYNAKDEIRILK